jgi:tRNA G18 (ribose-2'-O)-methylase SpoU
MRGVPIDDPDDPRLAMYRRLKATNLTRDAGQFVVEGETLFDRLVASRFPVVSVLASDRFEAAVAPRVPRGAAFYVVPERRVEELVGFNFHRGVLACGRRVPWPTADALAAAAGPRATVVVCPRLDNPENLGSILRLADVFGVDAVLAGDRCPDPLSRRVLRVSMGSALRVPLVTPPDLAGALDRLRRDHRFESLASVTEPSARALELVRRPDRLALLLGSEAAGLGPEWVARCDGRVTIPMRPGAESLNVAVAAGILLYHLTTGAL